MNHRKNSLQRSLALGLKRSLFLIPLTVIFISYQNCAPTGNQFRSATRSTSSAPVTDPKISPTPQPGVPPAIVFPPSGNSNFIEGSSCSSPSVCKAPNPQAAPNLNESYIDSIYGTKITRVTSASQLPPGYTAKPSIFVRQEYSRRPAFNSDSTRAIMLGENNGDLILYKVNANDTMTFDKFLPFSDNSEPNWHPTDPNIFYALDNAGIGMKIYQYNINAGAGAGTFTTVRDLGSDIKKIFPKATTAWTKGEGRPSDDGNIWCLRVDDANYKTLGLISYDFNAQKILGSMPVTEAPDHISTSPNGDYCVPSFDVAGVKAYNLTFTSSKIVSETGQHSDLALDAAGNQVLVVADYEGDSVTCKANATGIDGCVKMVDLATGKQTRLLGLYGPNSSATAVHISGVSKKKRGYAVVSTANCYEDSGMCNATTQWFKDKIFIIELKPSPKVYNVAHTHFGDANYWSEPHAVPNFDLTKILFVSTWGTTKESDISSYMIDIPITSLPSFP